MSKFEKLGLLVVVTGTVVGGYFLLQSPQLLELFGFSLERPPPSAAPAATRTSPVRRSPPPSPPAKSSRPETPVEERVDLPAPPRAQPAEAPPAVQNQVPNRQLASTLLQIMGARGLAYGVSLSVTDDTIEVNGETASAENRATILEIIEQGRESRRIVIQHFVVKQP